MSAGWKARWWLCTPLTLIERNEQKRKQTKMAPKQREQQTGFRLRWLPGKLDCEYTQFLDPISTNIKTNETRKMWGTSQMIIFAMWVRADCPLSKVAAACLDDANDANPLFGPEHHFTSRLLRTTSSSQIVCINVHNMSYEHIYQHLQTLTYDAVSDVVESGGQWRSNFHKVLKNC